MRHPTAKRGSTRSSAALMLEHQMRFYASQPVTYRTAWWEWALTQPNFDEMAAWARDNERDEHVLRALRDWTEHREKLKRQR